jgi:DNA-binding MarR family transcriptional regulator
MSERPFAGVFMPARLYMTDELSWIEKICLIDICALQTEARGCYAQNDHFSQQLHVSKARASEIIKGLQERGLIVVVFDRGDNGQTERRIYLTGAGRAWFNPVEFTVEPVAAVAPDAPPSENRTPLRKTEAPPSENRSQNKVIDNNNISLSARTREEVLAFREEVIEAAGEALADPAQCSGVAIVTELVYLLDDRPDAPACLRSEVIDAATAMGAWFLTTHGPRSMKSWRKVATKALELRDARLSPRPIKPQAKPTPKASDMGDPKDWTPERWRAMIKVAHMRGEWRPDYGPAPGEAGSYVPADLVPLWTGVSA